MKRHVQIDMFAKPKRKAGKGKRLGRPPTNGRAGSPHKKRPTLDARHPLHIVLRAIAAIGSLRRRDIYKAVRWATITAAKHEGFRIVHLSLSHTQYYAAAMAILED